MDAEIEHKVTEIFAHRGASAYAPENTMEAFRLAMEQKADGIELDVQLTKDKKLVIIHDETIDRVSDGHGRVKDYTLEELRAFSFHNGMKGFGKVKIPTLEEVLRLVKPSAIKVNIELKTGIYWYPEIEEMVKEAVQAEDMEERIIYSSFNHYSVQKMKKLAPNAKTAYLYSDVILNVDEYAKETGADAIHPALYHVKMGDFLNEYLKSGLRIRVWTVNEKKDMEMLIKARVDALITNKPDLAVRVRNGFSSLK